MKGSEHNVKAQFQSFFSVKYQKKFPVCIYGRLLWIWQQWTTSVLLNLEIFRCVNFNIQLFQLAGIWSKILGVDVNALENKARCKNTHSLEGMEHWLMSCLIIACKYILSLGKKDVCLRQQIWGVMYAYKMVAYFIILLNLYCKRRKGKELVGYSASWFKITLIALGPMSVYRQRLNDAEIPAHGINKSPLIYYLSTTLLQSWRKWW